MSGHSKWATNKRRKEAQDSKRSAVFNKLARVVTVAASKGADPETNFSLKMAIDKAKSANMPKDRIERAIQQAVGGSEAANLESVLYEAFAPNGIALLIEGITDNKNRSVSDVKAVLNKHGGSLGAPNSVKWMFEHKGTFRVALDQVENKDDLMLELIDAGADDVLEEEGGLTIYTSFASFEKIRKILQTKKLPTEYAEMDWVAKNVETLPEGASQEKTEKIVELLEDLNDVEKVYTNLK